MIKSDWHIHSRNSCDCKGAPLPTTMEETASAVRASGVLDFGITDHLHTLLNMPDIEASRREFDAMQPDPHAHFGVEASCVSAWELSVIAGRIKSEQELGRSAGEDACLLETWRDRAVYGLREGGPPNGEMALGISEEDVVRLGIEYVIGGAHWPLYVPVEREHVIRDYHRQNMFLACHPLVTIVAHPWWWMGHWKDADGFYRTDPWFDDFGKVPQSMHREFAAAACEHGKVVEINLHAMLLNWTYPRRFRQQYCEYLAGLKADGVRLSLGSDHHAQFSRYGYDESVTGLTELQRESMRFELALAMLEDVGIREDELWLLPSRENGFPE